MLSIGRPTLVTAVALMAFAGGCGTDKASSDRSLANQPPATPVKIEIARSTTVDDTSEYVATLKSRHSAVINPEVGGQVIQIYVHSGERVTAGTPLMQIDALKQQATLHSQEYAREAALANLRYAKQQRERVAKLFAEGVVSKQSLDEAQTALEAVEAQVKALEAQVREQQVQLHYYGVLAPTSGVVGDIPVRVGDRVTQSTLLTTVDQPGDLEAYIKVPVERARQLRLKRLVQILDDTGKVAAEGPIDFISAEVDDQTQSVLIKSRVNNPRGLLRTSQFVHARITWSSREGRLIPVLAVSRINGQFFAFVAEGEGRSLVARQRQIRVGQMIGNDYVVLDGIKAGDRIIVSGAQNLVDGAPVVPQK